MIPKHIVARQAILHKSDYYCKRFTTFQHLITLLYGVTAICTSLRELCAGIVSYGDKITHCKFDSTPNKSTLSDANKRRDCKVFEDIYFYRTTLYKNRKRSWTLIPLFRKTISSIIQSK